jgi:predicted RNase H-like nuclease
MYRAFRTFIGVDLGGGKGKTTAIARLRLLSGPAGPDGEAGVVLDDSGGEQPWYDERLIDYLLRHAGEAVVAIDAPLTLPVCVRCTLPACPTPPRCEVPVVRWFTERANGSRQNGKPVYTPYTQRATEVLLYEQDGILPRETLGQGMGPLTARAAYLRRALAGAYRLNENLLEVYPKATLARLFPDTEPEAGQVRPNRGIIYKDGNGRIPRGSGSRVARHYKRSGHALSVRQQILESLPRLAFGPGQWREFALQSDHRLDAVLCAYTAYLWARDGWEMPADPIYEEDGWIWFPPASLTAR